MNQVHENQCIGLNGEFHVVRLPTASVRNKTGPPLPGTQELTADDVQRTTGDVRTHVEALGSDFLLQFAHQNFALLREHVYEPIKDIVVEGWCDDLPVGMPLLTW
jgi:hypothetical protein